MSRLIERELQLADRFPIERVELVGPVDRQRADRAAILAQKIAISHGCLGCGSAGARIIAALRYVELSTDGLRSEGPQPRFCVGRGDSVVHPCHVKKTLADRATRTNSGARVGARVALGYTTAPFFRPATRAHRLQIPRIFLEAGMKFVWLLALAA